jgi:hypothetical protein
MLSASVEPTGWLEADVNVVLVKAGKNDECRVFARAQRGDGSWLEATTVAYFRYYRPEGDSET